MLIGRYENSCFIFSPESCLVDHALCSHHLSGCCGIPGTVGSKLVDLPTRKCHHWLCNENLPLVSSVPLLTHSLTPLLQSLCSSVDGYKSPGIWAGGWNKAMCLLHCNGLLCTRRNSYSLLLPSGETSLSCMRSSHLKKEVQEGYNRNSSIL